MEGVGGQLWRIQSPNGNVTTLTSNRPDNLPAQYEFVTPTLDEYTGLIVFNITSIWSGTTFQCIAFTPANEEEQNNSSTVVTLEVEGECKMSVYISQPFHFRHSITPNCTEKKNL